ncbi:NERD domain-containing protein [Alicyclobacillus curvatus]|nr:NERD domain-containing protein [Alicyclobacillus curvatus]
MSKFQRKRRSGLRPGPRPRFVSKIAIFGVVMLILSVLLSSSRDTFSHPLWASSASWLPALLLPIRILSAVLIVFGLLRAVFFRAKLAGIQKSKDAAGLLGEAETANELAKLGGRYRVLHRFFLHHRGRVHEFDHVVIGPNGVFHIETKNWAGEIVISNDGVARSVKGTYHDPMEQMHHHHTLLETMLVEHGVTTNITGVLCFTNRNATVRDVRNFGPERKRAASSLVHAGSMRGEAASPRGEAASPRGEAASPRGEAASPRVQERKSRERQGKRGHEFLVTQLQGLNSLIGHQVADRTLSPRDTARIMHLIEANSRPHRTESR